MRLCNSKPGVVKVIGSAGGAEDKEIINQWRGKEALAQRSLLWKHRERHGPNFHAVSAMIVRFVSGHFRLLYLFLPRWKKWSVQKSIVLRYTQSHSTRRGRTVMVTRTQSHFLLTPILTLLMKNFGQGASDNRHARKR